MHQTTLARKWYVLTELSVYHSNNIVHNELILTFNMAVSRNDSLA